MFKNVASQKMNLFAYNSTTGAPVTGLTTGATFAPYVSINSAAPAALATTTVTELDATNLPGWYAVQPSQAETNGDMLLFGGKSSTSNVYINGQPVFTDPPNYTTLSIDGSGRAKGDVDTIKTQAVTCAAGVTVLASVGTAATSTAQTGDNFARLGAPAGASVSADIVAINAKTTNLPAAPASTTNITAGTITTVTTTTNLTTNNDKTGYALTSGERNSVADAMLDRDMATGADSGSTTVRTVRQALRFNRNKVSIAAGTMTVTKEDDSTSSWTAAVTTTAGDPITSIDPAGP